MATNLNLSASKGLRLAIGLASLLIAATLSVSNSSAQSTEPLQSSTLVSENVDDVPEDAARNSPLVQPAPLADPIAAQISQPLASALALAAIPSGNANAGTMGTFGTPHDWPIMPIAMMLMPNGTVFAYGTDTIGNQGTQQYAIWDTLKAPDWNRSSPSSSLAFKLLPNGTKSDIFCSAQVHLSSNRALILGGDVDLDGVATNAGNKNVVIFDAKNSTLNQSSNLSLGKMPQARWYPTAITLPDRSTLVLGGQLTPLIEKDPGPDIPATYPNSKPDIRTEAGVWSTLTNAGGTAYPLGERAYGSFKGSWFYPRAWVDPGGKVFILTRFGEMFKLDTAAPGILSQYTAPLITQSSNKLSSVMFAPGKILSIRIGKEAIVVDINGVKDELDPVVTKVASLNWDRSYGSLTVLADGKVWANGGTSSPASDPEVPEQLNNESNGTILDSEIWDPLTNVWTTTARAIHSRHYHSSALLLPDGSVMTGGGGAPGPWNNLNGEIYYPSYLFNKLDNKPAPRPTIKLITEVPNNTDILTTRTRWNRKLTITAATGNSIQRITLVRAGAATHTINNETRFFELDISTGKGSNIVSVKTPADANVAPPGYYMVFAWNGKGVPSVAKIIEIS
jgi:hypothetical protein